MIRITYLIIFLIFCLPALSLQTWSPDTHFLDFEDIPEIFKKANTQKIQIVNFKQAPILIEKAAIKDKGSDQFQQLTGVQNNFELKVTNTSKKKILAYETTWLLRNAFEDFNYQVLTANSIKVLNPNSSQILKFTKAKYFREDGYYIVKISRVQFDDYSIWEAPEEDLTPSEKIKQEIESLPSDSPKS